MSPDEAYSTHILHPLHRTRIHHTRRRPFLRHDHTTDAKHCHHISIHRNVKEDSI